MAKRVLVFIFGLVTYLVFLLTVLYGIGFVGNILVPKSIDTGDQPPMVIALLIDLALIALFGVQHSVMARHPFKNWLVLRAPEAAMRSIYVLCASGILNLLFWQWRPIAPYIWSFPSGPLNLALQAAFWIGWGLVALSTFLIDHFDLFGLRQIYLYLRGRDYTPVPFKQPLIYRYVRHPLMLSFLIAFWATPQMSIGHLLFAAGMTVYILTGIALEEKDLLKSYGPGYEDYRQQVSMLLPLPRKKRLR